MHADHVEGEVAVALGGNRARETRVGQVFHRGCGKYLQSDEYHLQRGEKQVGHAIETETVRSACDAFRAGNELVQSEVLFGESVSIETRVTHRASSSLCFQYIVEKLFDFQFHVSAKAFFQGNSIKLYAALLHACLPPSANTLGAEVLYSLVKDSMELDKETVLLDICCGTGTIGITLANVGLFHQIRSP